MSSNFKNALLTESDVPVVENVQKKYTYEELIALLEKKADKPPHDDSHLINTCFAVMDLLHDIKEEYYNLGLLNDFSYKDVADIVYKCVKLSPIPEEYSDDESGDEYEDSAEM